MRAIFDNLTSGAGWRAELEYSIDSAAHHKANSIEVSAKSVRLSTQMHVTDWAEAQCEDPEIKAAMDWFCLDKRKSESWMEQLEKLKSRREEHAENADKLTLSGGLLYYRYKPKHQIKE